MVNIAARYPASDQITRFGTMPVWMKGVRNAARVPMRERWQMALRRDMAINNCRTNQLTGAKCRSCLKRICRKEISTGL